MGKTLRRMAAEEITDLVAVDAKLKAIKNELGAAVQARGSHLMDLRGVGPAGAARILSDVGDVARFPDRNHFASWTGTAPLDASSGDQIRHRLSRAGNRRLNHVLHIAAIVMTRDGSPPRGRWSSMPAWRRGRSCPAPSSGAPSSPGRAVHSCGWPPGGRCGGR